MYIIWERVIQNSRGFFAFQQNSTFLNDFRVIVILTNYSMRNSNLNSSLRNSIIIFLRMVFAAMALKFKSLVVFNFVEKTLNYLF